MTLLTVSASTVVIQAQQLEEQQLDRLRTALRLWEDAYATGEVKFENLVRFARRVVCELPDATRHAWLGSVVENALTITPAKRGRGNKGVPQALRKVAVDIVDLVREREQLPVNRASGDAGNKMSAFKRVAEILQECGISLSASEIEKWYYQDTTSPAI